MRDATKQVRDELTKRGVIWGKPAPEYWELLGGMPTRDYVTTVGDVNICETTAGDLVVENLSPEQAIAAVLGPRTCRRLPSSGETKCIVIRYGYEMEFGYWKCSNCGVECFEGAKYCMNCGAKAVAGDGE